MVERSLLKDDVLLSLSIPMPSHHMLVGVVGTLIVCVATYGPRKELSCAI